MSFAERATARSSAKSPEAFRTISEVSIELDVPQHVLRFWESKFGQIRPMKRGGGRRYYRPEDLDLLRGIRQLLYGDGYTIKGVQKVLRESGPRAVGEIGRVAGGGVPAPEPEIEIEETPAVAVAEASAPPRAFTVISSEDPQAALAALRAELLAIRALLVSADDEA